MLQSHRGTQRTWQTSRSSRRQLNHIRLQHVSGTRTSATATLAFPAFMPSEAQAIVEPAARSMLSRMRRVEVEIPSLRAEPVLTNVVGPELSGAEVSLGDSPPLVLLHGFDSSALEFRRLYPLLEGKVETWAVDLVGWGFSDYTPFSQDPNLVLTPDHKREHLYKFWEKHIQQPMVLVGTSLGGAVALDFARRHPEVVAKVVLLDSQGFIDGIGPMSKFPRWLAQAGVWVLRTEQLRMAANKMAYHDKERYATEDAMRCGRLHTFLPGWSDANVAFMRSGGYSISEDIGKVQQEVLLLWGRQDAILEPSYAAQFQRVLPRCTFHWVEECGHCPSLEQPQQTADLILDFLGVKSPVEDIATREERIVNVPLS